MWYECFLSVKLWTYGSVPFKSQTADAEVASVVPVPPIRTRKRVDVCSTMRL